MQVGGHIVGYECLYNETINGKLLMIKGFLVLSSLIHLLLHNIVNIWKLIYQSPVVLARF